MTLPQRKHNKPLGQIMLMVSFALGLGLLTYFFQDVLEKQDNPNQALASQINNDGSVSVVLERNRQGHYVLDGQINGVTARFLLDTGATDVVVPAALAETIGLIPGARSMAGTANGNIVVFNTRIDTLEVGDIHLRDISASINPAMSGDTVLLGMSALKRIEFTQSGNRLTLRLPR
jgi:aspartyl protease family protein